jgi:hypothetical protein
MYEERGGGCRRGSGSWDRMIGLSMQEPSQPKAGAGVDRGVATLESRLGTLRGRVRRLLAVRAGALIAATVIAACVVWGLADYAMRTPGWLRGGMLLVGLVGTAVAGRRLFMPALRFSPSLTELALRVERSEPGRERGLPGVLASGLELGRAHERGLAGELAQGVIRRAATGMGAIDPGLLVDPLGARRAIIVLGVAALGVVGLAVARPAQVGTGAARVLAPWAGVSWPKRTPVVDFTGERTHALGSALELRAGVAAPTAWADRARVWANYRVRYGESWGPERRVLLTAQDKSEPLGERAAKDAGVDSARVFERLIEPAAMARASDVRAGVEGELEYWFESDDDQTEASRVVLVEPPAVAGVTAVVKAPAYAVTRGEAQAERRVELGTGSDERAVIGGVLAGSRVTVTLAFNKPVPAPGEGEGTARAAQLARALGPDVGALAERGAGLESTFEGDHWTLAWTARQSVRLVVRPSDSHGIAAADEAVFRVDAIADAPASVTVTSPQADQSVLPGAVIEASGEARDDIALEYVGLDTRRAKPPQGSQARQAEPVEDWVQLARRTPEAGDGGGAAGGEGSPAEAARRALIESTLELAGYNLAPGDELWLTAVASDAYELDGERHPESRSQVRRLRVISQEQFTAQVWAELAAARRSLLKIDEDQAKLHDQMASPDASAGVERPQAGVTERLASEAKAVERVEKRVAENRLKDEELDGVLQQASDLLARAGESSTQASGKAGELARDPGNEQESKERARRVQSEQDKVRDRLAQAVRLLDRGQDAFAVRRELERLATRQGQIKERTADLTRQTAGKSSDQLSADQQQQLQQLAQEQQSLAEQTEEAIRRLTEKQQELEQKDPATAKALSEAARRGQRERVNQLMEQAAQQVQQNQGASAQNDQAQAQKTLEQMVQDLQNAASKRDEALRRKLADLIESIEALITQQQAELGRLAGAGNAAQAPVLAALAPGMIKVNTNTLGVQASAKEAGDETAKIADLLGEAADAQTGAIGALRAAAPNFTSANEGEARSLEKLQAAKAEAERMDEDAADREQERAKAELKKAYREALTEQSAILSETEPLVGKELSRRERAAARELGGRQKMLKDKLSDLHRATKELNEATVFDYAHKRLDELMDAASAPLNEGRAETAVTRRQRAALRVLESLVASLERSKNDNEFREQQQGGGGGGSGGGKQPLVPPIAQLKLLRDLQSQAADLTREAADTKDDGALQEAGSLQQDISAQAEKLLQEMQRRQNHAGDRGGDGGGDGAGGGQPKNPAAPESPAGAGGRP